MELQPESGAPKGIGKDNLRASLKVSAVHCGYPVGVLHIPQLRRTSVFQPGCEQHGTHGAVCQHHAVLSDEILEGVH